MGERDDEKWAEAVEQEEEHRRLLTVVSQQWEQITENL